MEPSPLDAETVCYLTTTGRVSGRPHEIEIWFAALGDSLYLISGDSTASDWVQNLMVDPAATVRVADGSMAVIGRVPVHPGEERTVAVDHLHDKYGAQVESSREDWHRTAFIVALDVHPHTR